MMDADRALRAYTDVLAVEHDHEAGLIRVVTLSDVYLLVPSEGLHQCGDRQHNGVDHCKHVFAADITHGRINAPTGWMVVEDLDDGGCADCRGLDGLPCADCYINAGRDSEGVGA